MRRKAARPLMALATLVALLVVTLSQPHTALAQDSDCFVLGDDIVVESGEVRDCSVLVGKGDVIVLEGGTVNGDVAVAGGDSEIAGQVDGGVWASGDIVLHATADVTGDVIAMGEVETLPGAHVGGRIGRVQSFGEAVEDTVGDETSDTSLSREESAALSIGFVIVLVVLATLFAALATILAPKSIGNVRGALATSPARALFLGLVALIAAPFLTLILLPVFPLIPVVMLVYLLLLAVGAVGLSEWFGRRLVSGARRPVQAATGAALLALVLSVAYALGAQVAYGWLLSAFTMLLQLVLASLAAGAAMLTLLGTKPWPREDEPADGMLVPLPGADSTEGAGPAGDLGADPEGGGAADAKAAGVAAGVTEVAGGAAAGDAAAAGAAAAAGVAVAADSAADDERDDDSAAPASLVGEAAEGPEAQTAAMAAIPLADAVEAEDGAPDVVEALDDEPTPGWGTTDPVEAHGGEAEPAAGGAEDAPGTATTDATASGDPPGLGGPSAADAVGAPPTGEAVGEARPVPKALGLGDVHGISPIYQHLLKVGGIGDLSSLASADPQVIAGIVSAPGVSPVNAETAARWVEQARELIA